MDKQKVFLGKILGEIYRMQKRTSDDLCFVSDSVIYGLLNGVERVIDSEIESVGFVSTEEEEKLVDIINEYYNDPDKLEKFKGYYEIEDKLINSKIDRGKAINVLTLLNLENRFTDVIEKMDSIHSPTECRTFKPHEWDV